MAESVQVIFLRLSGWMERCRHRAHRTRGSGGGKGDGYSFIGECQKRPCDRSIASQFSSTRHRSQSQQHVKLPFSGK
eukprot:3798415-Rhodomonas_salina.1